MKNMYVRSFDVYEDDVNFLLRVKDQTKEEFIKLFEGNPP